MVKALLPLLLIFCGLASLWYATEAIRERSRLLQRFFGPGHVTHLAYAGPLKLVGSVLAYVALGGVVTFVGAHDLVVTATIETAGFGAVSAGAVLALAGLVRMGRPRADAFLATFLEPLRTGDLDAAGRAVEDGRGAVVRLARPAIAVHARDLPPKSPGYRDVVQVDRAVEMRAALAEPLRAERRRALVLTTIAASIGIATVAVFEAMVGLQTSASAVAAVAAPVAGALSPYFGWRTLRDLRRTHDEIVATVSASV